MLYQLSYRVQASKLTRRGAGAHRVPPPPGREPIGTAPGKEGGGTAGGYAGISSVMRTTPGSPSTDVVVKPSTFASFSIVALSESTSP